MNKLPTNNTFDNILAINEAILRHLSNCENCHLKGILREALIEKENSHWASHPATNVRQTKQSIQGSCNPK